MQGVVRLLVYGARTVARADPLVRGVCFPFFFFQAEDGIRDKLVTGVQTCALPIWVRPTVRPSGRHATLRTASVTLCPPKPNELDSATSTCRLTAWFGAESRSQEIGRASCRERV